MMGLIEREALIERIIACTTFSTKREIVKEADKHQDSWIAGIAECLDEIEDFPSAEPEIVRCKDCMYYDTYYRGNESKPVITHLCKWCLDRTMEPDDYCSHAERR